MLEKQKQQNQTEVPIQVYITNSYNLKESNISKIKNNYIIPLKDALKVKLMPASSKLQDKNHKKCQSNVLM